MMGIGSILMLGIATFFNIAVIKYKIEKGRVADAFLDVFILMVVGAVFSDTITGLAVGTLASAMFSIYLIFSPPDLTRIEEWWEKDEVSENLDDYKK